MHLIIETPEDEIEVGCAESVLTLQIDEKEIKLCGLPPQTGGGGGGSDFGSQQDVFTATNGQVTYPLSETIRAGSALVMINGLVQPKTEYSVTGNQIVFSNGIGITAGDIIIVAYLT